MEKRVRSRSLPILSRRRRSPNLKIKKNPWHNMNGKFIKDAVAIVTQAIQEDHDQNYPKAYDLYKKSLEHFMIGLKCKSSIFLFSP